MRIVDQFEPFVPKALDNRFSVPSYSDLSRLASSDRSYPYMRVVTEDTGKIYFLSSDKTIWKELSFVAVKYNEYTGTTNYNGVIKTNISGYPLCATSVSYTFDKQYVSTKEVEKTIEVDGVSYTIVVVEPVVSIEPVTVLIYGVPGIDEGKICVQYMTSNGPVSNKELTVGLYYLEE